MDFIQEKIDELRAQRKRDIELKDELSEEIRLIELGLEAFGADLNVIAEPKPNKIDSQRRVLELLEDKRHLTVKDTWHLLQQEDWQGIQTEGGVRQLYGRLVKEGKVDVVEDIFPKTYAAKRNLKIIAGEGVVS